MLHFDHFEKMEKSNTKKYAMNPPWDNTGVDSTANNKYGHYKEYIEKSGGVEFPFDLDGTLMELNINTVFLNILFNADTCPDKEKHNKDFCEQVKYSSNETEWSVINTKYWELEQTLQTSKCQRHKAEKWKEIY